MGIWMTYFCLFYVTNNSKSLFYCSHLNSSSSFISHFYSPVFISNAILFSLSSFSFLTVTSRITMTHTGHEWPRCMPLIWWVRAIFFQNCKTLKMSKAHTLQNHYIWSQPVKTLLRVKHFHSCKMRCIMPINCRPLSEITAVLREVIQMRLYRMGRKPAFGFTTNCSVNQHNQFSILT